MTAWADAPAGTGAGPGAAASARRQRVPDFFVVGHPKCGTSALFEMLRRHPEIYMPDVKETWFFAPELRRTRPGRRERESVTQPRALERYLSLFAAARPDQRAGEATPSYLRSRTAAQRIAEVAPDARIVALLREPASFLRSLHLQFVQTNVETENDLRRALALEDDRREGRRVPARSAQPRDLLYADIVRYVEQLRRYHAAFGHEQVLVLIYDDFRSDNEATVRAVLDHLGVRDHTVIETVQANPSVRVRSTRLHELVHSVSVGAGPASRAAKAALKLFTSRRLRREALRVTRRRVVFAEPRPPDEDLMLELRRRFKNEVVALSDYLDRDLVSLWGYDDLD
jgi:hypothetical protein